MWVTICKNSKIPKISLSENWSKIERIKFKPNDPDIKYEIVSKESYKFKKAIDFGTICGNKKINYWPSLRLKNSERFLSSKLSWIFFEIKFLYGFVLFSPGWNRVSAHS